MRFARIILARNDLLIATSLLDTNYCDAGYHVLDKSNYTALLNEIRTGLRAGQINAGSEQRTFSLIS